MRLKFIFCLFCTFFMMIILSSASTYGQDNQSDSSPNFTNEEKIWIMNHQDQIFHIGSSQESSKLYRTKNGSYAGYGETLFKHIQSLTGLQFDYVLGDSTSLNKDLEIGSIDLVFGINQVDLKKVKIYVTSPIKTKKYWVCSSENFQSISNLENMRIGFLEENSIHDRFNLVYDDLTIRPMFYDSVESLFNGLTEQDIDAVIMEDCLSNNKYLNTYHIERNFDLVGITSDITIGGLEEQKMLVQIINRVIEKDPKGISQMIERSYITYIQNNLSLSEQSLKLIQQKESLRVGYIVDYLPFDYAKDGLNMGISAELLKVIAKVLEVDLEYIPYDSYKELEDALYTGSIDMISSYAYEVIEPEGTVGSDIYTTTHLASISNISNRKMTHILHDFNGYRIALSKESWQEQLLEINKIDFTPIYVDNIHDAMEAVNKNNADYAIDTLWTLNYLLKEVNYSKTRMVGELEIDHGLRLLLDEDQKDLLRGTDEIIALLNLDEIEQTGLNSDFQIQELNNIYEIMTITLFLFLCFIGIYISFLINRLNIEKQKAESANQSKSDFLAKMSHEIRTPLTAIMGYINLLIRSDNINGKEKHQLKIAYNSSNILIHLVNDILDFSKIEAGKVDLVEQPFNLRLMTNNAINIIGVMAEEKKLDFIVKLYPNLPRFIVGDERRLEQVLINILSNSVKFTESGFVELSISSEFIEDKIRLNYLVKDSGKGMKHETINMIFEAFAQEDNSISRRYGGTGLGLYISRELIERMGGEIRVNSLVDKGTEFEFYTMHKAAEATKEELQNENYVTMDELLDMKILLVEDNDINQMIIRDILVDMGFRVIITNNGLEALEVVSAAFDFVLMDIQMPVMNGSEAVKIMKCREELKNLPIIALTANVMPEQIDGYLKGGFDAYCSKPIMVDELIQTLLAMYEKYHLQK